MKKVGFVLLGLGCGMLAYLLFSPLFQKNHVLSPVEQPTSNVIIQEGVKK